MKTKNRKHKARKKQWYFTKQLLVPFPVHKFRVL
jgi:hypothetical protein